MTYTLTTSDTTVFTALRSFILDALGSSVTEVVRTPTNRVPLPNTFPFITMSSVMREQLAWPIVAISDPATQPQTQGLTMSTRYVIQIDIFGQTAGDLIHLLHTAFQSSTSFDFFATLIPQGVYPLYADDPLQSGFADGEREIENRWTMRVNLQYNATVTTSVQTASSVTATIINVEAAYS